ncbi:dethiobiotin synthase [Hathewaya limosa]|uniref:ATP-dependent dethiobiotin synthetase BioD n=1 Tax=Hathewaya limosa TaxID=1536 RepID=A0ABU0JTJ0_HATLI|nr:dethiobiotin synthase [Hathewaya limosa]MDQ0480421.1 dethiobiotin synthetase [Hathewaya limosa]
MSKGIFIVGTDTDVGKTIISAGIMYLLRSNGYNATYFKGALSGAIEENDKLIPGDTKEVCELSNLKEEYSDITPYIYKTPVSPHLASKLENNIINKEVMLDKYKILKKKYDYIVAEGSGGIICPLIDTKESIYLLEDFIKDLGMNVVIVTRADLGTINHTILTVKYIQGLETKIKGIIINGYKNNILCDDNIKIIKKLSNLPIIGIVNHIDNIHNENLRKDNIKLEIERSIDIRKIISIMDEI